MMQLCHRTVVTTLPVRSPTSARRRAVTFCQQQQSTDAGKRSLRRELLAVVAGATMSLQPLQAWALDSSSLPGGQAAGELAAAPLAGVDRTPLVLMGLGWIAVASAVAARESMPAKADSKKASDAN